jgi:hypothetical protein
MNRKLVLDDLPKLRIEDGRVLAGIGCALVNDVAPIDPVLQHQIECPARRRLLRSISKEIQRRRHLPFSPPPSPNFARKLTLVAAGHDFRDFHEESTLTPRERRAP